MDIRNRTDLLNSARQRLSAAPVHKTISAVYAGAAAAISLTVVVLGYVLGLAIDQSGGLSGMGNRAVLSAVRGMLRPVASMILVCLELGYLSAMLRISRGQYASPNGLRLGFDRFWVLLRCILFQGLIYGAIGFACMYVTTNIYLMTPFSNAFLEILTPVVEDASALSGQIVITDALYDQLLPALTPLLIILSVVYLAVLIPLAYSYRMVKFLIIEKPGMGALAALRLSRYIMKYNRLDLFKLDLRLWPYYLTLLLTAVLSYGDAIAAMLGVSLPVSAEVAYFGFYLLYLAAQFAAIVFLRSKAEVTYALAYDQIKPEEPKQGGGAVLGNIFQM